MGVGPLQRLLDLAAHGLVYVPAVLLKDGAQLGRLALCEQGEDALVVPVGYVPGEHVAHEPVAHLRLDLAVDAAHERAGALQVLRV